jgi:hypothetical protein
MNDRDCATGQELLVLVGISRRIHAKHEIRRAEREALAGFSTSAAEYNNLAVYRGCSVAAEISPTGRRHPGPITSPKRRC